MKRFDTEVCGETHQVRPLRSCRHLERQLEQVRRAVEREFAGRVNLHSNLFRLSLNEAEALAWQTGFPHLFFPSLADEKARAVVAWQQRQQTLRPAAEEFVVTAE